MPSAVLTVDMVRGFLNTAEDARNRDFEVAVAADCVTSFDLEAHAYSLEQMRRIFGVQIHAGHKELA